MKLPALAREEPFRLFFPLGVLLGWAGVGHWLLYPLGAVASYSCLAHGLALVQGFLVAFAAGFVLTALPKRTKSPPPSEIEIVALAVGLVTTTIAAASRRWVVAEAAHALSLTVLLRFAGARFFAANAGRRPPASFVLIPLGALGGIVGAGLIAVSARIEASAAALTVGRLLTEQGVFLCFALGAGALIVPLVRGATPPADLGSAPAETRRALGYAFIGLTIFATFVGEGCGSTRLAPLLRAGAVSFGGLLGGGSWRPPLKPGLHRRLVWLSLWMMPVGLTASAISVEYRVAALHVLFIGSFSLLAFGVATHVSFGHLGLEELALGRPPAVIALATGVFLALAARVAADVSHTYFAHLGWAAACWIGGSAIWLAPLVSRYLRAP